MLVGLGSVALNHIANALVDLLEDLARPYVGVASHPAHILQSELYIVALLADCCTSCWPALSTSSETDAGRPHTPSLLSENLVDRLLDAIRELLEPLPDDYVLPSQTLLGQVLESNACLSCIGDVHWRRVMGDWDEKTRTSNHLGDMDAHVKTIVECITATSWSSSLAYIKNVVYSIRMTSSFADTSSEPPQSSQASEQLAIVLARALPFFWVDGHKLGLIIQELCSSYLHLRKSCQNAVAAALPLLITRWIDRYPTQFVRLHSLHKKLDAGADTLFDMIQTGTDSGKRKTVLYPLQLTLLLLLPDVFEVASSMSEARSSSMVKKVSFLDGLKSALRNGNERAGYCLVALLRAARHFDSNNESALVSYAMDVQDEVKDAILKQAAFSSLDAPILDQDMTTGAFVSLAELDIHGCTDSLLKSCIVSTAPSRQKIAVVQACCYFAKQKCATESAALLEIALPFMQSQFEVRLFGGAMSSI